MCNFSKCYQVDNDVILQNVCNFDLEQTFDCGQCFRWEKSQRGYSGIVNGRMLDVIRIDNSIILKNVSLCEFNSFWADYFDLHTDYSKIIRNLKGIHPVLDEAMKQFSGIRILKQDIWETLCSFIISQNNNIPRIKKIISSLCQNFGKKVKDNYDFPSWNLLCNMRPEDLSSIRAGCRSKYIIDAAQKVAEGVVDLEKLKNMELIETVEKLSTINGVGPKIANCVVLYGLHNFEAFPEDVWIKKIMNKFFSGETFSIFGEYAGIAQQYLYHYIRKNPYLLE